MLRALGLARTPLANLRVIFRTGPLFFNGIKKGWSILPQRVVERKDGKTGSRRPLCARADSGRGRRGRPVLEEPVLGAADSKRRNCSRVLGVLSDVPEAISH